MIAVPELMRVLVDEKELEWDEAWEVTQQCFAYTCHTLLPEALEIWSTELLGRLLPRHLEIIYRINDEFLDEVRAAYPDDELRVRRMSIIADYPERSVRMAYLATVAGTKVNGVAALHSQLLRDKVLPDFSEPLAGEVHQRHQRRHPAALPAAWPTRALSNLITDTLGPGWVTDLERLRELEPLRRGRGLPRARSARSRRTTRPGSTRLLRARDGIDAARRTTCST